MRRFVDEGARVAGIDVKVPDTHPCSAFVAEDVRDGPASTEAVSGIVADLGPIDVLVNAAGVSSFGTADTIDEAEWDRVVDINLKGTWIVARAVLPGMVAQGAGSIVNLASVEGIEGGQSQTAYNASKGGVVLLTRSMAVDYGPNNVRVELPLPGHDPDTHDRAAARWWAPPGPRVVRVPASPRSLRPTRGGRGRCALPRLRRRVVRDRPRARSRRRLPRRPPLPRHP